jgi:hypothetical protein
MRTPFIRARAVALAGTCAGLAVLAGACGTGAGPSPAKAPSNGVASKPAAQILTTAKDALGSAKSVRLQGTMTQSGTTYTVDIVLGPGLGKGTVTGPIAGRKRASFDFVALGSKAYIRSSTLWRQIGGAAAADLFNNRWVATTAKEMFGGARFSTLSFFGTLGPMTGPASKGAATTINGQPAIPVTSGDSTVYVATTGTPYPLRLVPSSSKVGSGEINFLNYNAPLHITAPPNAIDLSSLHG